MQYKTTISLFHMLIVTVCSKLSHTFYHLVSKYNCKVNHIAYNFTLFYLLFTIFPIKLKYPWSDYRKMFATGNSVAGNTWGLTLLLKSALEIKVLEKLNFIVMSRYQVSVVSKNCLYLSIDFQNRIPNNRQTAHLA